MHVDHYTACMDLIFNDIDTKSNTHKHTLIQKHTHELTCTSLYYVGMVIFPHTDTHIIIVCIALFVYELAFD